MSYTNLRQVDGSVMLVVPLTMFKKLGLDAGNTVSLVIQDGELLAEYKRKISYNLADLLIEHQKIALEQNAWEGMKPVGREKI